MAAAAAATAEDEKTAGPDLDRLPKKTIVFLHPDLGIGGAERLVVDAAVGLQNRGHRVVVFTSHCDPKHCFDEARDGTLDVRVRGHTLVPPSLLGARFAVLCAILRQAHLLLQVAVFTGELAALRPDAFFVDQLSAGLPLLQGLGGGHRPPPRVLFYCHFPDQLLASGRQHWYKRAYRVPFDLLERYSMGFADAVAVNSRFTRDVVRQMWPRLGRAVEVVYPCVDVSGADAAEPRTRGGGNKEQEQEQQGDKARGKPEDAAAEDVEEDLEPLWKGQRFLLSINRFERKKNIGLAIRAFAALDPEARRDVKLVIAGGYDNRVAENVAYHQELVALAEGLSLRACTTRTLVTALRRDGGGSDGAEGPGPGDVDVLFLLSVPGPLKRVLLAQARLLVYTPAAEHFGIVPLEAMLAGLPVLAADAGGPVETVVDGATGWLRAPDRVADWAAVMHRVLHRTDAAERARIARAARDRVRERFGADHMARCLERILLAPAPAPRVRRNPLAVAVAFALLVLAGPAIALLAGAFLYRRAGGPR